MFFDIETAKSSILSIFWARRQLKTNFGKRREAKSFYEIVKAYMTYRGFTVVMI